MKSGLPTAEQKSTIVETLPAMPVSHDTHEVSQLSNDAVAKNPTRMWFSAKELKA